MSEPITKVGMTPAAEVIRGEILNDPHLPVARAAAIPGCAPRIRHRARKAVASKS